MGRRERTPWRSGPGSSSGLNKESVSECCFCPNSDRQQVKLWGEGCHNQSRVPMRVTLAQNDQRMERGRSEFKETREGPLEQWDER